MPEFSSRTLGDAQQFTEHLVIAFGGEKVEVQVIGQKAPEDSEALFTAPVISWMPISFALKACRPDIS